MKNGTTRTTEPTGECKGSELGAESRSVGVIPGIGGGIESDKVGVSREDSKTRNTSTREERGNSQIDGKVIDQLANQVRKEISYHKSQVEDLENKLEELCRLSGELEKTNNSD